MTNNVIVFALPGILERMTVPLRPFYIDKTEATEAFVI